MKLRALGGWCSLGIAVAVIGGGAIVGKRTIELNMLSSVLGPGAEAQAVKLHWMHSAGCVEKVTISLTGASESQQQTVELTAPKLWFAYDSAALMRKRFILPRVIIEDAIIASSAGVVDSSGVVDIDFGPAIELGEAVDLSDLTEPASAIPESVAPELVAVESKSSPETAAKFSLASTTVRATAATHVGTRQLPWLDELSSLRDSLGSQDFAQGRQVSIDADMVSERVQAFFTDKRQQSQRMLSDARDLHQQLLAMDNVLRHGAELLECMRRMELTQEALIKLRVEIGHVGKLLDDEQSRVRAALLVEKKQLLEQAEQLPTFETHDLAQAYFDYALSQQLREPKQALVILADLMRKPFRYAQPTRGQSLRPTSNKQPEFASDATDITGQVELAGRTRPFTAHGSFRVLSRSIDVQDAQSSRSRGTAKWQMSIEREQGAWQLDGTSELADELAEPMSHITLTSSTANQLKLDCIVEGNQVTLNGSINLPACLADDSSSSCVTEFAADYRSRPLAEQLLANTLLANTLLANTLMTNNLVTNTLAASNSAPESMSFQVGKADGPAVDWLAAQLSTAAARGLSDSYQQAAENLDKLVMQRLNDQKGMVATLRRDAEQHLATQMDELRRLQATISSLIEQRQSGTYFARQPGDVAR